LSFSERIDKRILRKWSRTTCRIQYSGELNIRNPEQN
jgi:hypothetical protein